MPELTRTKPLKTMFFSVVFTGKENLEIMQEDIRPVLELPPSQWEELFRYALKVNTTDSDREAESLYMKLPFDDLDGKPYSPGIAFSVNRFTQSFLSRFSNPKARDESLKDLLHDIQMLDLLPPPKEGKDKLSKSDQISLLERFLSALKELADQYRKDELKETTAHGALPYFNGINTSIELRGIYEEELKYGEHLVIPIDDLTPSIGVIPIVSISIAMDSGTPKRIGFQIDSPRLEYLIQKLRLALTRSRELEKNHPAKNPI